MCCILINVLCIVENNMFFWIKYSIIIIQIKLFYSNIQENKILSFLTVVSLHVICTPLLWLLLRFSNFHCFSVIQDVLQCHVLCVYSAFGLLTSLTRGLILFIKFETIFGNYFFKYLSCPLTFSPPGFHLYIYCQISLNPVHFFSQLCCILDGFCHYTFKSNDSFPSVINSVQYIFLFLEILFVSFKKYFSYFFIMLIFPPPS